VKLAFNYKSFRCNLILKKVTVFEDPNLLKSSLVILDLFVLRNKRLSETKPSLSNGSGTSGVTI
jgi:hypothetical protein